MHIRIRPQRTFSANEIDLGNLKFPDQWLQLPLPESPTRQAEHSSATLGKQWCGENQIDPNLGSMYRFDRAVWAVTIIDSLLFDCQTGSVAVHFVQEFDEQDYAIVTMCPRLLLDLRNLVKRYFDLPDDPHTVPEFEKQMRSSCIDMYSAHILPELKLMGYIPPNYPIWIASVKRKARARETCLKTKEMAEVLVINCGERLDPELEDWIKHCIDEPLNDTLQYILTHGSRISQEPGSSADTSCRSSSPGPPSTPPSRSSDASSASSDDSPSPAEDIDLYAQYLNDFGLSSDMLRHVDPKRMARLLPPKLSRRGLMMDAEAKDKLDGLEARICYYMNDVRKLEKLIADEDKKEKELKNGYLPATLVKGGGNEEVPCKESYNLRARRSSTPVHELYGKKKKKSQNSFHRSLAKRSKKKKVKTPEEYETEWNRRQDSPYPRRHSEIITGTSANEMVLFAETQSSDNIDIEVDLSNLRKKHKSKEMKKRKLETIREDSEESIRKKLKLTVKLAGRVIGRGDYKYVLVEDEEDELDDPDWEESHLDRKKKKSTRTGKDLGHRGVLEETLGDSVPPSTARYLATLRAPYSSAVGSEHISQSELQALSSVASGAASLTTPPRASISRSSSSTSLASDSREDSEPGWEIGSRTPLALQSLSHASSRSNSARNLRSSPSARSSSGRPALRRERSTVHPNAFFVGVPAELAAAVLSSNENSLAAEMEDIPVPVQGTQLHDASNGEEIHVMSEQQDCEEDELILGILSPERQLSPTEEGEESSIFDETCPELDELSSSPEELDDIGMQDGFGNSAAGDDNELANEGLKHCPTRMDFAVHAKGEEVRDEAEERTASEDEEEEDEDEEDEDASRASSSPIERPEDLFDDEVAGEEIRNHEATVCRLRESISLRGGLPEKEETEEDIGFVQGLLERCDIHVHRPGSPLPKEPVIFPVKQEKKDIKLGQNKQRKLKKSKKKLGSVARKNKTMLEVLNNITLGLSMASNITLLRSSASLHAGHQENNDSLTPPLDTPARAMMDVTQNAPTSPQRVILQRPITRTYPSKRGNKQKVYTPPGNPSSTTYGKGASVSRPGSPYRTSSEARDVDTPIGINEFLNGFRGVNEEENTEVADDRSYELLQARKDCQGTPEKLGDSKGVSSAIVNDEVRPQSIKVPLSPVNGAKQKRYPGMLLSPERSIRGTS